MRDNATLLLSLVSAAGSVMDKPLPTVRNADLLVGLRDEIQAALAKPAPDGRVIFEEDWLLAQALAFHASAVNGGEVERAITMQQVIGVLLPIARAHFGAAIDARRRIIRHD